MVELNSLAIEKTISKTESALQTTLHTQTSNSIPTETHTQLTANRFNWEGNYFTIKS